MSGQRNQQIKRSRWRLCFGLFLAALSAAGVNSAKTQPAEDPQSAPYAAAFSQAAHSIWQDGRSRSVTKVEAIEGTSYGDLRLRLLECEGEQFTAGLSPSPASCERGEAGLGWAARAALLYLPSVRAESVRVVHGDPEDGTKGLAVALLCDFDPLCGQVEPPLAWLSRRETVIPCPNGRLCGQIAHAIRVAARQGDRPPSGDIATVEALAAAYVGAAAWDRRYIVATGRITTSPDGHALLVSYACGYQDLTPEEAVAACRDGGVSPRRLRVAFSLRDLEGSSLSIKTPAPDGRDGGYSLALVCKGGRPCVSIDGAPASLETWHIVCRDEMQCARLSAALRAVRSKS